jgi:hypothetical protein
MTALGTLDEELQHDARANQQSGARRRLVPKEIVDHGLSDFDSRIGRFPDATDPSTTSLKCSSARIRAPATERAIRSLVRLYERMRS